MGNDAGQLHVAAHRDRHAAFLEHVALITDIDLANGAAEAVSLMTLHSAKGLEFDIVLLTGLEEGLLPHWRSIEPQEDAQPTGGVEEERRLFYVGMTRARQELWLLHAAYRSLAGRSDRAPPSRFLADLPGARPLGNIATGLLAGVNASRHLEGRSLLELPQATVIGALCRYVTHADGRTFQPMKANLGILEPLVVRPHARQDRSRAYATQSERAILGIAAEL